MRKLVLGAVTVAAMGFSGMAAFAGSAGWMLDGDASTVAFGSIKKDVAGESHHFSRLSGAVSDTGDVAIEIDLSSVETWIDKRNERIVEHVFMNAPTATFNAQVDIENLNDLAVGAMQDVGLNGTLTLGGAEISVQADMIAVRLSEMRVMILSAEMIWVSTEEAGINDGVTKLMELAKLPSITRAFPVTLRLVFDHKM